MYVWKGCLIWMMFDDKDKGGLMEETEVDEREA